MVHNIGNILSIIQKILNRMYKLYKILLKRDNKMEIIKEHTSYTKNV